MNNLHNNRIVKYDVARVFAILRIILCHCSDYIYGYNFNFINNLSISSKVFYFSAFTIGRLGVPIFLFLSGALLLKKTIESDTNVLDFYKKNLLPLIIANTIWVFIYNLFFYLTCQENLVSIENIIKELLFLEKVPSLQMWYIPMIIGIYIGIPFVAKVIKSFSFKAFLPILILIFISNFILPTINVFFKIFGSKEIYESLLSISFLGAQYGLYVILGYYISINNKIKANKLWTCLIGLISFIVIIGIQILSYSTISKYNNFVWYDNVFLLICSACLFIVINDMHDEKINLKLSKNLYFISRMSLALFFIHPIILYFTKNEIIKLSIINPLKVVLLFIFTTLISTIFVIIMSKVRILSKYLLIIKKMK